MKIESLSYAGHTLARSPEVAENLERQRKESAPEGITSPDEKKLQSEEILTKIKELTGNGVYSVRFETHKNTGKLVIKLVDSESGETIRQIPPEELLHISERLNGLRGNLLDAQS